MKLYQIVADTYMESYGSTIVSFGIFSTKEKAIETMKNYNCKVLEFISKYNNIPLVDYSLYEENPTEENYCRFVQEKVFERENSLKELKNNIDVSVYFEDYYDELTTKNTFTFNETNFDRYIKEIELDNLNCISFGGYCE